MFEPSVANAEFIRGAFRGLPGFTLRQVAVSDAAGTGTLCSSGSSEAYLTDSPGDASETVDLTTLDDALSEIEPSRPIVMKIDVEGHEPSVLRGMAALLRRQVRPIVQLEFLPPAVGDHRRRIDETLAAILSPGYEVFGICQVHGVLHRRAPGDVEGDAVLNILLVPEELRSRVDGCFVGPAVLPKEHPDGCSFSRERR